MTVTRDRANPSWGTRDGFAMPVVLLAMVVMTILAAAALTTAGDEQKSAQAVRESGLAFYAAEAGLWQSWANWPTDSTVTDLAEGASLDLGWDTLDNGASYRSEIVRWGPEMFGLVVEGRGAGPLSGQRWLSLLIRLAPGSMIGRCCFGPALVDGDVSMSSYQTELLGQDAHPDGWEEAGVCPDEMEDKPALVMKDTTQLDLSQAILDGSPPLVEDASISESTFMDFGPDKTWEDLKAEAGITIGRWGTREQVFRPRPSYNADGSCNTADVNNWGSDDPNDPCFNLFRIILAQGDVAIHGTGFGQGLIILDWQGNKGTEIDFENDARFNGIILGKGCIEIQGGSTMTGSVFADGNYFNQDLCQGDSVLDLNADREGGPGSGDLRWSSCVINRTLDWLGLEEYSADGGFQLVSTRSFSQLPR
jgi:hypothetical protein